MIRGDEPNIVARLGDPSKAPPSSEIKEQKKFNTWLTKLRDAGALWFINPRSDKRSTIAVGHPDFSIWLPAGRTLLLEFKAPGAKRTSAQDSAADTLSRLGHSVVLVYSAEAAMRIVTQYLPTFNSSTLFICNQTQKR